MSAQEDAKMAKRTLSLRDGRYLIYYEFTRTEDAEALDVGVEMESTAGRMDGDGDASSGSDLSPSA